MNTEEQQINWYDDYMINESINESIGTIIGGYSRLITKYSTHKDIEQWKESEKMWINFERKLLDLEIYDKTEADKLVSDLANNAKQIVALIAKLEEK